MTDNLDRAYVTRMIDHHCVVALQNYQIAFTTGIHSGAGKPDPAVLWKIELIRQAGRKVMSTNYVKRTGALEVLTRYSGGLLGDLSWKILQLTAQVTVG